MATNAPPSRKTHIVRLCFRNRAGDRIVDKSIDIERTDVIKSGTQIPPDLQWQGVQRKLRWHDDPDGQDAYFPEGAPSRLTEVVKVCDASEEADVNDPEEYAEVRVIKGMKSKGGGAQTMGQGFMDRFRNQETNNSRVAKARKIVHYDTNIDDRAQAAFDADPDRMAFVVPGKDYEKHLSTKDDSQFVDHEIPLYLKSKTNTRKVMGQAQQARLRNEYLIDESEPADGGVIGVDGINPPYRLDEYQTIVNVNLGGLAVEFLDGDL